MTIRSTLMTIRQRWWLQSTRYRIKLSSALTEHPGFDSWHGQTISSPKRPDRISDSPGKWIDLHETYLPISQTKNYERVRDIAAPSARRLGVLHTLSKHIRVLNPYNNRKFGPSPHKKKPPPSGFQRQDVWGNNPSLIQKSYQEY